jgi:hypothetical protein
LILSYLIKIGRGRPCAFMHVCNSSCERIIALSFSPLAGWVWVLTFHLALPNANTVPPRLSGRSIDPSMHRSAGRYIDSEEDSPARPLSIRSLAILIIAELLNFLARPIHRPLPNYSGQSSSTDLACTLLVQLCMCCTLCRASTEASYRPDATINWLQYLLFLCSY